MGLSEFFVKLYSIKKKQWSYENEDLGTFSHNPFHPFPVAYKLFEKNCQKAQGTNRHRKFKQAKAQENASQVVLEEVLCQTPARVP